MMEKQRHLPGIDTCTMAELEAYKNSDEGKKQAERRKQIRLEN
jgi:hypothetical protein